LQAFRQLSKMQGREEDTLNRYEGKIKLGKAEHNWRCALRGDGLLKTKKMRYAIKNKAKGGNPGQGVPGELDT